MYGVGMAIDDALDRVEAQLQEEGQRVVSAIHGAIRALQNRDVELADEVIAFDDEIDGQFLAIQGAVTALLALQTPVARDLRLLLAILHINLLLERSADGCVTVAKLSRLVADADPDPALVAVLVEMATGPRKWCVWRSIRSRSGIWPEPRASSSSTS